MKFDIHVDDRLEEGCPDMEPIESTTNLTAEEVGAWLADACHWCFRVTEHGNPKNLFITGTVGQSMTAPWI